MGQGRLSLLRHGLRRHGRRQKRQSRRHPRRSQQPQRRIALSQGLHAYSGAQFQGARDPAHAAPPERRQAGARQLGRGPGSDGQEVPRQHRHLRPQFRGLVRIGPVSDRRNLCGQQDFQGRLRHQQCGRQPAPVHGLGRGRLSDQFRQGRAHGHLCRHRPCLLFLHHRFQHLGSPSRALPAHCPPQADGAGGQNHRGRPAPHQYLAHRGPAHCLPAGNGSGAHAQHGLGDHQ